MEISEYFNSVTNGELIWIDIDKPNRAILLNLSKIYQLHPLNIEDCLSKIQVQKLDKYNDHMFIVLHCPYYERGELHHIQLSIFIGNNYLITVHNGEIRFLKDMFNNCKDDKQKQSIMGTSSGYLLYKIIDNMVDELLNILTKIEGNVEDIQEMIFKSNVYPIFQLSYIRLEIIALRRIVLPLRRIIKEISKNIQKYSTMDLTDYIDDVSDHIEKAKEILETSRKTIGVWKDIYYVLYTVKTNKILAILTLIVTIPLPFHLIAALYGMNVLVPLNKDDTTDMPLGKYTSFIIIMLIATCISLFMLYVFYKQRWFDLERVDKI